VHGWHVSQAQLEASKPWRGISRRQPAGLQCSTPHIYAMSLAMMCVNYTCGTVACLVHDASCLLPVFVPRT
jgi:hypothetical protein